MKPEHKNANDLEMLMHPVGLKDWYATQVGRSVEIFERGAETASLVLRPPEAWGEAWTWNLYDDGVYFKRT